MYSVTLTRDNESLARIYGPTHFFPHPTAGRLMLSPVPEPLDNERDALRVFALASDWMDAAIIDGDLSSSTVTLRGPLGMFRSHSFRRSPHAPLSLAKPAHPNLFTNA